MAALLLDRVELVLAKPPRYRVWRQSLPALLRVPPPPPLRMGDPKR